MNSFQRQDWSYLIYSLPGEELKEALPPNMPKPLGHVFKIRCFVDADHAGESIYWYVERCSHLLAIEKADLCRDEHLWELDDGNEASGRLDSGILLQTKNVWYSG